MVWNWVRGSTGLLRTHLDWLLERTVGADATDQSRLVRPHHWPGFCQWCLSHCWSPWTSRSGIGDDGRWVHTHVKQHILGLEIKQIQALGRTEGVSASVTVQGYKVVVAQEFVYLGSLIHSSVQSTHDINHCSAIAHATRFGGQVFQPRRSWSCTTHAICLSSYMGWIAGQFWRQTQERLMLLSSGVYECC